MYFLIPNVSSLRIHHRCLVLLSFWSLNVLFYSMSLLPSSFLQYCTMVFDLGLRMSFVHALVSGRFGLVLVLVCFLQASLFVFFICPNFLSFFVSAIVLVSCPCLLPSIVLVVCPCLLPSIVLVVCPCLFPSIVLVYCPCLFPSIVLVCCPLFVT